MGLVRLDFGFLWIGILDSDGVWVGFGLIGWVGMVGNGGGVVGCLVVFAMGLLGFVFFFFFLGVGGGGFGSGGVGEQRAVVTWWVVGCFTRSLVGI